MLCVITALCNIRKLRDMMPRKKEECWKENQGLSQLRVHGDALCRCAFEGVLVNATEVYHFCLQKSFPSALFEHVKVLLHKGSEWTLALYIWESLLNPFLIILIWNRSRSISSTLVYDIHFDIARIQSQINRCNSFLSVREKALATPRHIHLGLKAKNLGEDAVISESIYSVAEHENISPGTAFLSACFSWQGTLVCTNWFAFLEKFHVCSGALMKSMNKLPHSLLFWLHDAESIRTWVKIWWNKGKFRATTSGLSVSQTQLASIIDW